MSVSYKVDKARSFTTNSSGLGLALVADIVWAYGGVIDVQSMVGNREVENRLEDTTGS